MSFRFNTRHLTSQQQAIISQRDRADDERRKNTNSEKEEQFSYKVTFNVDKPYGGSKDTSGNYSELITRVNKEFQRCTYELVDYDGYEFNTPNATVNSILTSKIDHEPSDIKERFEKAGHGIVKGVHVSRLAP